MSVNPLLKNIPDEFIPETVLLIGNGAIIGPTWEPISIFKKEYSKTFFNSLPSRADIYSTFADDSLFLAKFSFFKQMSKRLHQKDKDQATKEILEDNVKGRKRISELYRQHLDKFKVRNLPEQINQFLVSRNKTAIITTNWEPTIIQKYKYPNIFIHGIIESPETLLLPTENVFEFDNHNLNLAHNTSMEWLKACKHLIIWGIGFHEYDSELAGLLLTSEPKHNRYLTIINPDLQARSRGIALAHTSKINLKVISHEIISNHPTLT